jgi:hypothetical protein
VKALKTHGVFSDLVELSKKHAPTGLGKEDFVDDTGRKRVNKNTKYICMASYHKRGAVRQLEKHTGNTRNGKGVVHRNMGMEMGGGMGYHHYGNGFGNSEDEDDFFGMYNYKGTPKVKGAKVESAKAQEVATEVEQEGADASQVGCLLVDERGNDLDVDDPLFDGRQIAYNKTLEVMRPAIEKLVKERIEGVRKSME